MKSRTRNKQKKNHKKWLIWLIGIISVVILGVGGYLYYLYDKMGDTISTIHAPLDRDSNSDHQKEIADLFKKNESLNILLLGVDQRPGDKGRSDTMILLSLNPRINSLAMLSIPRDTYVNIPGYGMDKINHAYAFGDTELSVQTVEETFNLPIHFYMKVDMEGFKRGIDAIGGVTVKNDQDFSQGSNLFSKGDVHLGGDQALAFIRMRKDDPRGDFGRNDRQRRVVTAAIQKAGNFSNITNADNILNILGDHAKTDLTMDHIQTLFSDYRGVRRKIKTVNIKGSGKTLDKWYYMVSDDEFNRIHQEIKKHMEAK